MKKFKYRDKISTEYAINLTNLTESFDFEDLISHILSHVGKKNFKKLHSDFEKQFYFKNTRLSKEDKEMVKEQFADCKKSIRALNLKTYVEAVIVLLVKYRRNSSLDPFLELLRSQLKRNLTEIKKSIPKTDILLKRIGKIKSVFSLSDTDIKVIQFLLMMSKDPRNKALFTSTAIDMNHMLDKMEEVSVLLDVDVASIGDALKEESRLILSGAIEMDEDGEANLTPHISRFLLGASSENLFENISQSVENKTYLQLEDFSIPQENISTILNLLKTNTPLNILFHGSPGTGKTELAKIIAKDSGLIPIFVNQSQKQSSDNILSYRKSQLFYFQGILSNEKHVLVVDEADALINTESGYSWESKNSDEKSWLNRYLDSNKSKIIWICNKTCDIDESTKRRFSYSQEFKELNQKQRAKAWKIQSDLQNNTFLTDSIIDDLSKKYTVSPGVLSLALKNTLSFGGIGAEKQFSVLNNILEQQQKLCMGTNSELAPIRSGYSLEGINADHSMDKIVNSSKIFFSRKTYKNANREVINLNILLSGPPGTGKTEFAKYLSEQTGRDILVKRASDILDMYVGGTEKNISRIFSEAEESNSILFLDEADSLFINRENAKQSWESSQTNELLCQMENFKGLLICATNLASNMDPAIMRRFTYKVKFDYLKPESNRVFFDKILAPISNGDLSEVENSRLSKISKLTPGDFKAVYQKFAFEEKVEPKELVDALTVEIEYRKKTTGSQIKSLGM